MKEDCRVAKIKRDNSREIISTVEQGYPFVI